VGLPYRAAMSRAPALLTVAVSSAIHAASTGSFFDPATELVKISEDALQELDNEIDR
jgi:hypothetical protein